MRAVKNFIEASIVTVPLRPRWYLYHPPRLQAIPRTSSESKPCLIPQGKGSWRNVCENTSSTGPYPHKGKGTTSSPQHQAADHRSVQEYGHPRRTAIINRFSAKSTFGAAAGSLSLDANHGDRNHPRFRFSSALHSGSRTGSKSDQHTVRRPRYEVYDDIIRCLCSTERWFSDGGADTVTFSREERDPCRTGFRDVFLRPE